MESSAAANVAAYSGNNGQDLGSSVADTVVQYVVLRRYLIDTWLLGSVDNSGLPRLRRRYLAVQILSFTVPLPTLIRCTSATPEVKSEAQIRNLSEKLEAGGVAHKLWLEKPHENIPTCLATKPYPKSFVSSFFKKLKLCNDTHSSTISVAVTTIDGNFVLRCKL